VLAAPAVAVLVATGGSGQTGDETPRKGKKDTASRGVVQDPRRPPPKALKERPAPASREKAGVGNTGFRTIMNDQVVRALDYMVTRVPVEDRCYTRFLSLYDQTDLEYLRGLWKVGNWWNNQMSFDEYFHLVKPVPGSGNTLFALDLRDYRWNSPAWEAVARREPRFRQPWVHFKAAEQLRREAGYYGTKPDADDTTPVIVVMSWVWFMRDTLEAQRSPSYYDLLFAERRFVPDKAKTYTFRMRYGEREDWPGGVDPEDGKEYPAGRYTRWHTEERCVQDWAAYEFHDFPKNEDELEEALGIDKVRAFARANQTDVDNGAIVAGGKDDPQRGSIVALQNRLVVILDGPLGPYMVTNDVAKTSGVRDFSNSLIFAGRKFRRGRGARAVKDAGEILFYLRNGGQGGMLVNGRGERVNLAAQLVAQETTDRVMNIGVRTHGSCVTCHAGGGGYVPPDDLYRRWKDAGIKFKFYDREQANRVEGFFKGLDERMLSARRRFEKLVEDTTAPVAGDPPGTKTMTGADLAAAVRDFRHFYDEPVTIDIAASEMGLPAPALKWLLVRVGPEGRKGGIANRYNTQAQALVQGLGIPRTSWDEDVLRQAGLAADAYATDPDFGKLFDTVQVPKPDRARR
jgi:hypothetical protein